MALGGKLHAYLSMAFSFHLHHQNNVNPTNNHGIKSTTRQQRNAQREHDVNNRRRRERRSQENVNSFLAACSCNIDTFDPDTANIITANDFGPINVECDYCHALGFEVEFKWNQEDEHCLFGHK